MPEDVKKDLHEVDEAIGDVTTLENFVLQAAVLLGARIEKIKLSLNRLNKLIDNRASRT